MNVLPNIYFEALSSCMLLNWVLLVQEGVYLIYWETSAIQGILNGITSQSCDKGTIK